MRKFFKKIHLWISVPAGLVISITCLTGAILVFEKEILALAHPQLYRCEVPEGSEMMSREEIGQSLGGIYIPGIEGQAEVASVRFPEKENGCAMVTFKGAGRKTLSVNPYTGEINGWVERSGFFTTVRQLHRWMLDVPETKGSKTVGNWFPKGPRMLRSRFGVSCTKGWKRFLYDSHVSLGFYCLLLLLVMALTGLTWSFGWYRDAFYAVAGAEPGQLKGLIFSLHTGTWGGIWSKILYFIAAFIGGTLPLTGYWLWLKK